MKFYIVDVFAEEKWAGNQLAVLPQAADLSTEQMQQITREFNFSETTFITGVPEPDGCYPVRIFTPAEEVPFAGHPTVGTAWVIRNLLRDDQLPRVTLDLKGGPIQVAFENASGLGTMTTRPPEFHTTLSPESIADVLDLTCDDLDTRTPIQVVSTGLPALIVPVTSLAAVQGIQVSAQKAKALAQTSDIGKVILVFCPETVANDAQLHVRVFCPLVNIPEDPATGSANSCLAGYLLQHRYFQSNEIDIQVEQGLEIGRPSRLYLQAKKMQDQIQEQVSGKVQLIAEGKLIGNWKLKPKAGIRRLHISSVLNRACE